MWITEHYNQRGGKPLCVCIVVYSLSHVQLFCNSMDCSPPDFSVHGISQARILEWVVTSFFRDLPDPGIEPVFLHCRWILYHWATRKAPTIYASLSIYGMRISSFICKWVSIHVSIYEISLYLYSYTYTFTYIILHTSLTKELLLL